MHERHQMRRLLAFITIFLFLVPFSAAHAEINSYRLTWSDPASPNVAVDATVFIVDGELRTSNVWNTFFESPHGWADFIEIEQAADESGNLLPVRRGPANGWQIGDGYSGMTTLHYRVDFSFASERWPVGNEQVALFVDGGLYTTGLPLFVIGEDVENSEVHIVVPDDWQVSTSWSDQGDRSYLVDSEERLTRNAIAVGHFHHEVFAAGPFELRIALLGEIAQSGQLIRDTFMDVFEYYGDVYKPTDSAVFMIAMIPGPNDGEAYTDSFAAAAPSPPGMTDRVVWANLLAHEFGHYWNGKRITTAPEHYAERQWFSEGGTEYVAILALKEAGLIDDTIHRQILSRYLSMHLLFAQNPNFADVTLREAGSAKWSNRPGVYDSGVAAAYCLDGIIRQHTDQSRSFVDVLAEMDKEFGAAGLPYVFDDIIAAASAVAGSDLAEFFDLYISAKAELPVSACAAWMGDSVAIDGYHVYLL